MNRIDAIVLGLQQKIEGTGLGKIEQAKEWFDDDTLGTVDEMRA